MNNKIIFSLICLLCTSILSFGQYNANDIIMTIGGEKITKAEFERIYLKNNQEKKVTKESLDEYLDLFINFKLKVIEAQSKGLDTTQAFINELAGYRKQLVKPYLVDEQVVDQMMKEAYERMKTEIKASHILISVNEYADPKDTLKAYNKALNIYKKAKKGEKFEDLAEKYSEDPSAKTNKGNLGYRKALETIYPFENKMYEMKVDEISKPFRTQYGYHILKVYDKRPTRYVKVAHIILPVQPNATDEKKKQVKDTMMYIEKQLKKGADFAEMVKKYSADKSSLDKGGELDWFGAGRMIPEFEKAAFGLKNKGQLSQPFQTKIGWHILKLIDNKGVDPFDEMRSELKVKVSRDGRAEKGKQAVINKLKREYNYKQISDLKAFYKVADNSLFEGKWTADKADGITSDLFLLDEKKYNSKDFAEFLASKRRYEQIPLKNFIDKRYKDFVNEKVIEYEDSQLEKKYPDFKYLMKEYHDGILLFELTDKLVWSKAVADTAGLKAYYEKHKNEYKWDKRLDVVVFNFTDDKIVKKLEKRLAKKERKGYSNEDIVGYFNKKEKLVSIGNKGIYLKDDDPLIGKIFKGMEAGSIRKNAKTVVFTKEKKIVYINKVVAPQPKALNDARGLITADYQNFLEKEWIKELRKKYKFKVNKDVLYSIAD